MKKWTIFLLVIAAIPQRTWGELKKATTLQSPKKNQADKKDRYSEIPVIDTIVVKIYGPLRTDIITKYEVNLPALDGSKRTLDDLILERLMYQDAEKYHMLADEDAIDKQLKGVMRDNNLDADQMDKIFTNSGYSYLDGRRQFGIMIAVNSIVNFKITSRMIVPDKEVVAYYDTHPEIEEAAYHIQRTEVPFSTIQSKEQQILRLEKMARLGKTSNDIAWGDAFWVHESELATHLKFITSMKEGAICQPIETGTGFELYKFLEKKPERLRTLQERYREIVTILRQPKLREMLDQYKKELLANATIVYLDQPES